MTLSPLILSFEIAVVATAIAAVLGVGIAALLANFRFPGRDLVELVCTAPIAMPPTVLGYYLLAVMGRKTVIGHAFEALTGTSLVFTRAGCVVAALLAALPLIVKGVRADLEDTDPTLVLAARTLGATPLRAFFTVQLPLATRGIAAALMLAFARAMGDFGLTLMIGGNIPGETRTASLAIFDLIESQHDAQATGLVLALTALVLVLLYAVGKLTRRRA